MMHVRELLKMYLRIFHLRVLYWFMECTYGHYVIQHYNDAWNQANGL